MAVIASKVVPRHGEECDVPDSLTGWVGGQVSKTFHPEPAAAASPRLLRVLEERDSDAIGDGAHRADEIRGPSARGIDTLSRSRRDMTRGTPPADMHRRRRRAGEGAPSWQAGLSAWVRRVRSPGAPHASAQMPNTRRLEQDDARQSSRAILPCRKLAVDSGAASQSVHR